MARDVAALGGLILGIATKIQSIGNNWYTANAALDKLPGQVGHLQEKVEILQREARNIPGLSSDAALIKRLHVVKTALQEEQKKLEKRAGSGVSRCCTQVSMTMFPAQVGLTIQSATDVFDAILKTLGSRQDIKDVVNKVRMGTAVSTFIAPDTRYVPLVDSEEEIRRALECAEGPGVVLLHGGPGFGKSTLARNMVVHYINLPVDMRNRKFDLVFFVNCGPGAKAEDTQLDIIRRLGYEPAASTQGTEKGGQIENQLQGLLAAQKVLLVLDNVSDGDFLHKIVKLCGTQVKCLVTSQRADLCQRVLEKNRYVSVQIQVVAPEIARKILASHLELLNHEIPPKLQELADKMISETDCIPLALSSLAYSIDIDPDQANKLDVWEDASKHFFDALKSDVPTMVHAAKYERSFWATTRLRINELSEDAKNLLLLTSACKGSSVPERIVQVMYRSKKLMRVVGHFSNARRQLVNRHLIKTSPSATNLGTEEIESNWSMHSLLKRYIEEELKERRDSMFTSLGHSKDAAEQVTIDQIEDIEEKMVTTVCALYLEEELGNQDYFFSKYEYKYVYEDRKRAIEPVTCLLGRITSEERWTQTARDYAMKVFVKYICDDGELYVEGISYILGLPSSAPAILEALEDMTRGPWMYKLRDDENSSSLMNALVNLLAEGVDKSMQMVALQVLDNFVNGTVQVYNWLSKSSKFPRESVLEGNVRVLLTISDHQVQVCCAQLFLSLVRMLGNQGNKMELLVGWGGVVAWLVNSLQSKAEYYWLEIEATFMLRRIAFVAPMVLKIDILNFPGLLQKLMWSLSNNVDPQIQAMFVDILCNLLDGVDQNKATIANCPDVLKGLARLLCESEIGDLPLEKRKGTRNLQVEGDRDFATLAKVVQVFATLARVEGDCSKMKIKATEGVIGHLLTLSMASIDTLPNGSDGSVKDGFVQECQYFAVEALTLMDHAEGNKQCLHSGNAYGGRARANARLGFYTQALADLEKAEKLTYYDNKQMLRQMRYCITAKMGNFEEAMKDMEGAIGYRPQYLQERGVVKRMMNDLNGALADFNDGLELETGDYEMLKHRGYVKFLMNDDDGAHADAKWALQIKPASVDCDSYGETILGGTSVEYLGYKLK